MKNRVLLIGATPEVAELCRAASDDDTTVATCPHGEAARDELREEVAHVVIAAETLPDESGVRVLTYARERRPTCVRILLVETANADSLIEAVNSAEIFRFLVQPLRLDQMTKVLSDALVIGRVAEAQEAVWLAAKRQQEAMEGLLSQGRAREPELAGPLSTRFLPGPSREARQPSGNLRAELAERLSLRERQIVSLLGTGQRVKEIAGVMAISTHTVRNHLKAIYRKLNVRSQFELLGMLTRA